jgi:hypothetical protein
MRIGIAVVVSGSLLIVGCSHKAEYQSVVQHYHDDIGTLASYASLLDASSFGNADPRVVVPAAQDEALRRICTISRDKTMPTTNEPKGVEKEVVAAFAAAKKGCCDSLTTSEVATAKSCSNAMKTESAMLAAIEADAVKAGLPAGSILPSAPPYDPPALAKDIDAIRVAAKPTPEEAKLATLWVDPAVTLDDLTKACQAASASDPKSDIEGAANDIGAFIGHRRAADTWMKCNNLAQYIGSTQLDAATTKVSGAGPDAALCTTMRLKHDVAPPAALHDALTAIQKRRCAATAP